MENTIILFLLSIAGIIFIGTFGLVIWFLRRGVHRRQWIMLGVALFFEALLVGVILYQQITTVQTNRLNLFMGVLMVIVASFTLAGFYLLGSRSLSEVHSKSIAQQTLERFQLSFEKNPQIQVIKDIQGNYLAANSAYGQLLGKKHQELIGESDFNFLPRSQAIAFRQEEDKVIESGKPHTQEEKIRGINGIHWFQLNRIPLVDPNNSVIGVLTSGYDITTRKNGEAALAEWKRGLILLRKAQKAFEENTDFESLLDSILSWAGELCESTHAGMWFMIPEKSYAILKTGSGKLKSYIETQLRPGKDIAWKVWESGQPVIVKDYKSWPDRGDWSLNSDFQSGIGIPMKVNDVTTTVLTLFHDEPGITYKEERVAILGVFAGVASSRLNQIKKVDSMKGKIQECQIAFSKLQYRSGLDHVNAAIAAQFISINPQKIDKAIHQALVTISEKSDIEFCYLVLFPKNAYSNLQQPLAYSSASNEQTMDDYDFSRKSFDWCLDSLNQFEVVYIPSLTNLSPKDEQAKTFLQSKSIQSFLALPLISNRLVIGFMGLESRKTEKDWSEIISLFKVSADQFVNVLQRKWDAHESSLIHEQTLNQVQILEKRSYETSLITEMGDLLQSCRTADEAYPIITRYIQKMIPIGSGALYMIQHSQDPAERVATWGDLVPSPLENELLLNECWALRRGRIYVVKDPIHDPICGHVKEPKDVGYICVPLIAQGVAIGVLHLRLNKTKIEFPDDRQEIVVKIGELASMALTNLKLRDELRAQAIRDPLTGLFNRRYMEETLEREIRRAHRHSTSVGVIMFDIDKMKPINDKFGHDAGDLVLRTLGEELLRLFRSEDVACRYGGDEFTIVLPEASLADAWLRAEQMRETIKNLSLQYEGNKLGSITLSIGVAAYPDHGPSADSLLLASDAGSYAAKSEGGDRIMVGHRDDNAEKIL